MWVVVEGDVETGLVRHGGFGLWVSSGVMDKIDRVYTLCISPTAYVKISHEPGCLISDSIQPLVSSLSPS